MFTEKRKLINIVILLLGLFGLGSSCDNNDVVRTSISGLYTCQEYSSLGDYKSYFVEIDKRANFDYEYTISNFHNIGENNFIYVEVIEDSIFINYEPFNGIIFNGKGTYTNDFKEVYLDYSMDDGVYIDQFSVRYKR